MTDRKFAHVAIDQIEAGAKDDIDSESDEDELGVAVEERGGEAAEGEAGDDEDWQGPAPKGGASKKVLQGAHWLNFLIRWGTEDAERFENENEEEE